MTCSRLSLTLAALLAAGPASAQEAAAVTPVVVWMDREAPDEASIAKAERLAGGVAKHYDTSDLIFPPDARIHLEDLSEHDLMAHMGGEDDQWEDLSDEDD